METDTIVAIYIDGNNLYRAAKEKGFKIDYRKLHGWLRQKYHATKIYLFIGYLESNLAFYTNLESIGYTLVFKQTVLVHGTVKGNCDAELVLQAVSDFYTKTFTFCYVITGDGDFGCLISFLKDNGVFGSLLAPDFNKCSILLKNKDVPIVFLDNHYHKFATQLK